MIPKNSKPEPLTAWIERIIRTPAGSAAEPGPIRLYPYQRGIAAAIGDPGIERVSVLKSARVGYTALLTASSAHFVVRRLQRAGIVAGIGKRKPASVARKQVPRHLHLLRLDLVEFGVVEQQTAPLLTRASAVLNCQLALAWCLLRWSCHALRLDREGCYAPETTPAATSSEGEERARLAL
jgi:Phage terminase large subunit (GpA)